MFIEKQIEVNTDFALHSYESFPQNLEGIVLISHGMAEHGARYQPFAEFLATKNWGCIAYDHRGHGKTSDANGHRGFIADQKGWDILIDDLKLVYQKTQSRFPKVPIVLLGHSMGAILAASFITKSNIKPNKLVLSALAFHPGLLLPLGKNLSAVLGMLLGKNKPSKIMDKLTFGDFNKSFKNPRTPFEWLSRKEEEVDKYINDPACGEVFTNQFFNDMLTGLDMVYKGLNQWPADLPTLMLAGENDPVVGFKKKALETIGKFQTTSEMVKGITYPEGRHEIMNELNRNEVFQDIFNWINHD